jgi:hypothetical protein
LTIHKKTDIVFINKDEVMKFFNYEKIYLASVANPTLMLDYFRASNTGNNFIVNPRVLSDFWVSDRHKAEYLGFCSLRPYNDYVTHKIVDLKIQDLPPWVPLEIAKENPYLTVTNTQIIFEKEK